MIYCTYADYSFNDILYICWLQLQWYLVHMLIHSFFAHVAICTSLISMLIFKFDSFCSCSLTIGYFCSSAIPLAYFAYAEYHWLYFCNWLSQCELCNWHSATPLAFTMCIHQLTFSHTIGLYNVNSSTDIQPQNWLSQCELCNWHSAIPWQGIIHSNLQQITSLSFLILN